MRPDDPRHRLAGLQATTASPVARLLGALAGAAMFVAALFVGGLLLLVFLALAAALAAVLGVRLWWWRRQMAKSGGAPNAGPTPGASGGSGTTIDGDYNVIDDR